MSKKVVVVPVWNNIGPEFGIYVRTIYGTYTEQKVMGFRSTHEEAMKYAGEVLDYIRTQENQKKNFFSQYATIVVGEVSV